MIVYFLPKDISHTLIEQLLIEHLLCAKHWAIFVNVFTKTNLCQNWYIQEETNWFDLGGTVLLLRHPTSSQSTHQLSCEPPILGISLGLY